jgi:DNA primase
MDVMALDKAGIPSAVALMGTSLTAEQISLLRKLNCEVRLCLDGDAPGQAGMMKMITQLNRSGIAFRLLSATPAISAILTISCRNPGPKRSRRA